MAGYREFQTGEVLTAANVDDFLAKQAVQKYADAAARDAALGTEVGGGNALRQGMVAYLDDTDEVIKYDGTAWTTVGNAGIGSNVVQTVKTDVFSTTATSPLAVTGLSVTITPSSATSRVLLIAQLHLGGLVTRSALVRLSGGNSATYIGDDPGGARQTQVTTYFSANEQANRDANRAQVYATTPVFLDAPDTTSPVTYSVTLRTNSSDSPVYINRDGVFDNLSSVGQTASSLTAIEVAA